MSEARGKEKDLHSLGQEVRDLALIRMERLVEVARVVGEALCRELKMNQIRRFLDGVRRIESQLKGKTPFDQLKDEIILLRPQLAYAVGREKKVKPLMDVLDPAISSGAQTRENFEKLLRLVEGIVAYHRFYGGTN